MSEEREYDFAVTVEDDGVGFDTKVIPSPEKEGKDHRHGIGLQNTKKRLELMCGGTLAIKSEPGKGTVCLITIPKEKYETGEET
jgi:sensor histidine kinase YesM